MTHEISQPAFGAPGAEPRWTHSTKIGLGTDGSFPQNSFINGCAMATAKKAATKKKKSAKKSADPCWEGYEQVGTKKKAGKTVPNCVPKK